MIPKQSSVPMAFREFRSTYCGLVVDVMEELMKFALAMYQSFSKSQARRRLRRPFALASQGHNFVITKHGKAACLLVAEKREGGVVAPRTAMGNGIKPL
jgi:hypothetical protein